MIKLDEKPTLSNVLQEALKANNMSFYVSMPAIVESVVNSEQRVSATILLQKKYKDDTAPTTRPIIEDVPIHYPSGLSGSAFVHVPLKKGDVGMLVFCDRSLDVYLASDGKKPVLPDDQRLHDISDAFFIPGVNPWKRALADVSDENITIKNDQIKISIKPDGTMTFEGGSAEMMSVISSFIENHVELVDRLIAARIVTALGPSPFETSTILELQDSRDKFEVNRDNFNTLKG